MSSSIIMTCSPQQLIVFIFCSGNSVMSNGNSHVTTKTDSNLDTWSRRSLRMLRSIANATFTDDDSDESSGDAEDAAWKMESFVGPRIGSVGRSSIRVEIQKLKLGETAANLYS